MKKDINLPEVENVGVAVVHETNEENEEVYNVYLLNTGDNKLETVLVSSKGYGENAATGEQVKTSVLRHALNDVDPKSFVKIEPIIEDLFGLHNEYWVSYFIGDQMYDKKFIFLAESINDQNLTTIPLMNKKGILIT
ncbi:MAG: hypothetical protein KDC84_08400 [Crocinitomicaceae bacterium]|nr:hypothetical protein [Crocinitomicaceae bacterium]